uniref:C2H2-type domain-containing protein n=1 Tax=Bactrocera latifrons TaxID=174628 RepID=A0A0K8UGF7_BACLA
MDISVQKCGEVTTCLKERKKEYFLNCIFCDGMFVTLDKFGKHLEYVHLHSSDGYDQELLEDYKIKEEIISPMDADPEEVVNVTLILYFQMQYKFLYYTEKCYY